MTNDTPFTFENLVWASRECMKGVGWKNGTARWRMNILPYCRRLERELSGGTYRQGKPNTFVITSPKKRTVSSILFRDRVVHKVLCHQGGFIKDMFRNTYKENCACQEGRGTHYAIGLLEENLRGHFRQFGREGYIVEMDVRKFFDSIPHEQVVEYVYHRVRLPIVRKMVTDIIRGYPGEIGIGLGSEISQVIANSYLTAVDYVVKQSLGVKRYVRYADNLVCIIPPFVEEVDGEGNAVTVSGKEIAKRVYAGVKRALWTLGLDVNPCSYIHPLRRTIHFLGFRWTLTGSGIVERRVLRKSVTRIKRKLHRLVAKYRKGEVGKRQVMASFEGWAAYAKNSYNVNKIKDNLLEELK